MESIIITRVFISVSGAASPEPEPEHAGLGVQQVGFGLQQTGLGLQHLGAELQQFEELPRPSKILNTSSSPDPESQQLDLELQHFLTTGLQHFGLGLQQPSSWRNKSSSPALACVAESRNAPIENINITRIFISLSPCS